MKRYWVLILLLLSLVSVPVVETGCRKTLAPGGAYTQVGGGGIVGYNTDLSITTSKDVIEVFLTWEKSNRAALVKTPEVRVYADKLRAEAPAWIKSAVALSDAYKANPTTENLNAFNASMSVIQAAVGQAQQYFAKAVNNK